MRSAPPATQPPSLGRRFPIRPGKSASFYTALTVTNEGAAYARKSTVKCQMRPRSKQLTMAPAWRRMAGRSGRAPTSSHAARFPGS